MQRCTRYTVHRQMQIWQVVIMVDTHEACCNLFLVPDPVLTATASYLLCSSVSHDHLKQNFALKINIHTEFIMTEGSKSAAQLL